MAKEELVIGTGDQELENLEMSVLVKDNSIEESKKIAEAADKLDDSFIDEELQAFIDDFPALDEM